jgi:hypothetical protein
MRHKFPGTRKPGYYPLRKLCPRGQSFVFLSRAKNAVKLYLSWIRRRIRRASLV